MTTESSASDKARAEEFIIQAWEEATLGNYKNAMDLSAEAFALDSDDWYINTSIGLFLRKQDKLRESKGFCERAIELAPDNSRVWENLAITYLEQTQYNLAVMHFTKAVELAEKPGTYTMMASAKIPLGGLEGAIKDSKRALELDPEWDEAEAMLKQAQDLLDAG